MAKTTHLKCVKNIHELESKDKWYKDVPLGFMENNRNWLCPGLDQGSHKICAGNLSQKIGGNCLENWFMHSSANLIFLLSCRHAVNNVKRKTLSKGDKKRL